MSKFSRGIFKISATKCCLSVRACLRSLSFLRTLSMKEKSSSVSHNKFVAFCSRFEPANAKYFHEEICLTSLCDTLRLLGCFSSLSVIDEYEETSCISLNEETISKFESIFDALFVSNISNINIPKEIPANISYACLILRLLYDVTLDSLDKPRANVSFKSPSHKAVLSKGGSQCKRGNSLDLTLVPPAPEPIVVHPGMLFFFQQSCSLHKNIL